MSESFAAAVARRLREAPGEAAGWPPMHVLGPDEQTPVPFHLGQTWAWEAREREIALSAGTQGGKTSWLPWWLHREIMERGRGDYYAVSATYDLFKLKLAPALLFVFEHTLGIGRYWAGDRVIEIADPRTGAFLAQKAMDPMWARIILRSADAPGGLESGTGKGAVCDESSMFPLIAYRALRRRLATHRGRICHASTLYNLAWFKREVLDRAEGGRTTVEELGNGAIVERAVGGGVCRIFFDSIVNPSYPLEEWEDARRALSPDEFEMMMRGRPAALRALIYDCFVDSRIVASFEPPRGWPRAVGIDPIGAATGAVWLAYDDAKEQLHVYREYLEPFGVTTGGHARALLDLSREERVLAWICGAPSERQARLDWEAAGVPVVEPPFGDVWAGIGRVYALIKEGALVVHDCCENLIDELRSYQRRRARGGEMMDEIQDKGRFHLLDALRGVVAWLTEGAERTELAYEPVRIGPRL